MKTTFGKIGALVFLMMSLCPLAASAQTQDLEEMKALYMAETANFIEEYKYLEDYFYNIRERCNGDFGSEFSQELQACLLAKTDSLLTIADLTDDETLQLQQIADSIPDSDYPLYERMDELEYYLNYLRAYMEETMAIISSINTMEQLAESGIDDRIALIQNEINKVKDELDELTYYYSDKYESFDIEHVTNYYNTLMEIALKYDYPLFSDGDLFLSDTLLFRVLSAKDKTCRLEQGRARDCPWFDGDTKTMTFQDIVSPMEFRLTSIGVDAFSNIQMERIVCNEALEEICTYAFYYTYLKSVYISKNVKKLSGRAFDNRGPLEKLEVDPQNSWYQSVGGNKGIVETATHTLVKACPDLEIPSDVTTIGTGAYMFSSTLTKVVIPDGVTTISDMAFFNCYNLSEFNLPSKLTEIGSSAFSSCNKINRLVFPATLQSIGSSAFHSCYGVKEIIIPAGVTEIGTMAFAYNRSLESLHVQMEKPFEIYPDVFELKMEYGSIIYPYIPLYVPVGTREAYAATEGWNKFKKILEEGEVDLEPVDSLDMDLEGVEDLSGVVINNIYYSVDKESGDTYNEEEKCLIFKSSVSEEQEEDLDNTATVPEDFMGLCFMVPAGSGRVTVDVETSGDRTVGVKIGSEPAKRYAANERQQIVVEYKVSSPTYIYVYPSNKGVASARGTRGGEDELKIYGVKWEVTNYEPIKIGSKGKATYCGDKDLDFSFSDEVKAFIATGFDKDSNTIWLTRVKDVPAGVPVLIKGEADKTYEVPVSTGGSSYYVNMFEGNTSGDKITIYEEEEDPDRGMLLNYYMKDGQFVSVSGSASIGNNKCYLRLPKYFEPTVLIIDADSQPVKIAGTGKSSFAPTQTDLDFSGFGDDLKAFTATGYDASTKTIWLSRVMRVHYGEGLLLKGTANKTYDIPFAAVQAVYANLFVGNSNDGDKEIEEKSDDGFWTNYYLKDGTFVSVKGSAKIGVGKSYLHLPTYMLAGARDEDAQEASGMQNEYTFVELETESMPLILGETTGIESMDNGPLDPEGRLLPEGTQEWIMDNASDEWYDLRGRRVSKPAKKGLYIHNGRKVVIK